MEVLTLNMGGLLGQSQPLTHNPSARKVGRSAAKEVPTTNI